MLFVIFPNMKTVNQVNIKKADSEMQVVWGEVYVPNTLDAHNHFMNAFEIRKMAYSFLGKGRIDQIDINHDNKLYGAFVVESFIAREGDPVFVPDSWVIGVHIPDEALWLSVKNGTLNGFSFEGSVIVTDVEVEVEIPDSVQGVTTEEEGHVHIFTARFDDEGNFLGGETDEVDGHTHTISLGTITDYSEGTVALNHRHQFALLDTGVLKVVSYN